MSTSSTHTVSDGVGTRLDKYLTGRYPHLSRSHIQRLISEGHITVNGSVPRSSYQVQGGDRVRVCFPAEPSPRPTPTPMSLRILYEDDDLLVIDKPAGIPTHPAPGHREQTLANALLACCPALARVGDPERPGIVHRLDKDTSGLLMVAKTPGAFTSLSGQLKAREVEKRYVALVKGRVSPPEGVIDASIGRDPRHRKRMAVVQGGREAISEYKVLRHLDGYTLLEVRPRTGRTHQIRVHLAAIGHPVAGDATYGGRDQVCKRQLLHASFLGFRHPTTGQRIELSSPIPEDLEKALKDLS